MEFNIEKVLYQGEVAHKEGRVQDAERFYQAILQSQPLHPEANYNLGLLALSINKTDVAFPLFKTALEANPKIEKFWLSYIDVLIKEQQLDAAKQVLEKAKKQGINGKKLNSLKTQLVLMLQLKNANRGSPSEKQLSILLEYYQTGKFGDAEKLAQSLTERFPKYQFSWKVLGAVLSQIGKNSEAVNANQTAVALSPQDAAALNNLGASLKELGRLDEAEVSYTQAIALKPDFAEAHSNLGVTLQELGRLDEAEVSYTQAIALKPDYVEAHYNLGVTLQKMGRLDEAEVSYMQAIALKPDFAEVHNNLGVILQKMGRLDEAEVSYMHAIALKSDFAEVHSNIGDI